MIAASRVDQVLERALEAGDVPGVVALAADDRSVIYEGAFGKREVGTAPNMSSDTVVGIASMTKTATSVAAMQLVEQGRVGLDEPLAERLPELAAIQVLAGFDAAGAPRLRSPRRPLTLRHLLTHTAGFGYDIWNADLIRYQEYTGIPSIGEGKNVTLLRTPLVCDPGERWEYGISTDWVGKAVEHLSGRSLEEYFREYVFDPLGMDDTGFVLRSDQQSRLASWHVRQPDGSLEVDASENPPEPEFYSGGGDLYSTGPDFLRLLRMLLGGGQLGGVRVLRPESVAEMGKNQIGELCVGSLKTAIPFLSNDAEFFPGMVKKWGLAYMITTRETPAGRSAGSLTWAGLGNTYFWIDPTRRVTGVLLTQILPFADARVLDLFEQFERAIYAGRN